MGVRAEQQAKRDRVVMAAATELFWKQGYSATTIPMIAEKADPTRQRALAAARQMAAEPDGVSMAIRRLQRLIVQ